MLPHMIGERTFLNADDYFSFRKRNPNALEQVCHSINYLRQNYIDALDSVLHQGLYPERNRLLEVFLNKIEDAIDDDPPAGGYILLKFIIAATLARCSTILDVEW